MIDRQKAIAWSCIAAFLAVFWTTVVWLLVTKVDWTPWG